MDEQEVNNFVITGRSAVSTLAMAGEQLKRFADSFEARGGEPVYGQDALEIVYLSNSFQEWLTPERRATISRLRSDI